MKAHMRGEGFVQGARENLGEIAKALRGMTSPEYVLDAALGLEGQARVLRQIVEQMSEKAKIEQ